MSAENKSKYSELKKHKMSENKETEFPCKSCNYQAKVGWKYTHNLYI